VLATEMSILYFAFAAWRRTPFTPTGARAFSAHQRDGRAGILYTIALISIVEVFVVDLVVRIHASQVANGLLVVGVAGAIWIVGFARAIQLRPTFIARDVVGLRNGLRHSLDVPRDLIASIELGRTPPPAKNTAGYLRIAHGAPNITLIMREPIIARGSHGIARLVTRVDLTLDDPAAFRTALGI
jgi:hypothetical protein